MDLEQILKRDLLAHRLGVTWRNLQTAVSAAGKAKVIKQLRHLRKVKPRHGAKPPVLVPVVARKLSQERRK